MKILPFLCLILMAGLDSAVFAANTVGNGGDVMVCTPPDGRRSVELLDYYEARVMRELTIDLGSPTLSVSEKVRQVLNRIRIFDPALADLYQGYADSFDQDRKMLNDIDLPDINDSGEIWRENFCQVKQIAVQREPQHFLDKRYWIDQRLWDLTENNDSKAGLILHEVIYRDALARGHENSLHVRFVTGLISSTEMFDPEMNANKFAEILQDEMLMGYSFFYSNYPLEITHTLFDRKGPLSYQEAEEFCLSLPGNSHILWGAPPDRSNHDNYFSSKSAIYRKITGTDGQGSLRVWAPPGPNGKARVFIFSPNGFINAVDVSDSNERNYVICVSQ